MTLLLGMAYMGNPSQLREAKLSEERSSNLLSALKKSKRVVISENILKMIIEGKVKIAVGKKLKYGKYRIVRRYVAKE